MYFKNKLGFMINIIQIKVLKTVHGKGFTNMQTFKSIFLSKQTFFFNISFIFLFPFLGENKNRVKLFIRQLFG
jgi:hypothetical protein